jgi:hypothetical protein
LRTGRFARGLAILEDQDAERLFFLVGLHVGEQALGHIRLHLATLSYHSEMRKEFKGQR